MLDVIVLLVSVLGIYLGIGFLFACYFVVWGVKGHGVIGTSFVLRLMLLPCGCLLWPVLLFGSKPPVTVAHDDAQTYKHKEEK